MRELYLKKWISHDTLNQPVFFFTETCSLCCLYWLRWARAVNKDQTKGKKTLGLVSFYPLSLRSVHAHLSEFQKQLSGRQKRPNCKQIRFKIPSVPALYCDRSLLFSWKDQNLKTLLVGKHQRWSLKNKKQHLKALHEHFRCASQGWNGPCWSSWPENLGYSAVFTPETLKMGKPDLD